MMMSGLIIAMAAIGAAAAPASDPASVFQSYKVAVETDDTAAIAAMVADDPAPPPFYRCQPGQTNRECLIGYIDQTVVRTHSKLTVFNVATTGDTVEAKLELRNDLTRAAGVDRLAGTDRIKVADGKIVAFAFVRDEADPQTQKFFAYMRSTMGPGGPPPGGPPPR